ncbi:MAG: hypothetical protein L0220_35580, partial [Acidobacteria bacterium]|nr:hypothetical protein [Acidobacteriota bacterium]
MRWNLPKTILIFVTFVLVALFFAQQGWSQSPPPPAPGRDMNREKAIWQALKKIAPKSVETFKAATEVFDRNEYEKAVILYRQVMEKAPGFDPVYRRLGAALALSGKTDEGHKYLERAIEMNPSPENLSMFALVLYEPGEG